MMATTKAQGAAMAVQLKRVNNDDDPAALREENRQLKLTIEMLKERIGAQAATIEKYQAARTAAPASAGKWVTTAEYCAAHHVSMCYLNRALNGIEGYRLSVPGRQSPTKRWLVDSSATFTHHKKSKQSQ